MLTVVALFVATGMIAAAIGVGGVLLVRHLQGNQTASGSPSAAPGTTNGAAEARALYQRAVAKTRAASGFHYVGVSTAFNAQTIVGDAGKSGGRQVITLNSTYGGEQFTLLLVGPTVFFEGNAPALEDQLGVPVATAPTLGGKWISVLTGDGPYAVLQPGITTGDQAIEMPLNAVSSSRVTSAGGITATRISGIVPPFNGNPAGTGSLEIASSTDLPIVYTSTGSAGTAVQTFTTTFSSWGTAPVVSAPTAAIAWSSLTTAAPPGGYGSGGLATPAPTPTPGAI